MSYGLQPGFYCTPRVSLFTNGHSHIKAATEIQIIKLNSNQSPSYADTCPNSFEFLNFFTKLQTLRRNSLAKASTLFFILVQYSSFVSTRSNTGLGGLEGVWSQKPYVLQRPIPFTRNKWQKTLREQRKQPKTLRGCATLMNKQGGLLTRKPCETLRNVAKPFKTLRKRTTSYQATEELLSNLARLRKDHS